MYQKILLIFLFFLFNNCIGYLLHLGNEQLNQIKTRENITELLENKNIKKSLKKQLILLNKIQNFAINNLYLNSKSKYQYYYQISRKEIGWNVSASYPLELKSYNWWFPIIGSVPYKGFFNFELAKKEEEKLKALNLDTKIRITGGYSTLGWFSDPIFSKQLQLTEINLAALIFHEMSHSTIYFNGDSTFNESYASFIEKEGVKKYIIEAKGKQELEKYIKRLEKEKVWITLKQKTAKKLSNIYNSDITNKEKLAQKSSIIENFKKEVIKNNVINKKSIQKFLDQKLNNEDFIGTIRYNSGDKFFLKKLKEANYDFEKFNKSIKSLKKLTKGERKKLLFQN